VEQLKAALDAYDHMMVNIVVSVVLGLAAALAGQTIGAHW